MARWHQNTQMALVRATNHIKVALFLFILVATMEKCKQIN